MGSLEGLLHLQMIDTELSQLEHKKAHLPERDVVESVLKQLGLHETRRRELAGEIATLTATVDANEDAGSGIRRQVDRLSSQLRTVIAPREAEALQHEIAVLAARLSDLDDESLVAIEKTGELDAEVGRLVVEVAGLESMLRDAQTALESAIEGLLTRLAEVRAGREGLVASLDPVAVARYEKHRYDNAGIAVARLVRTTCGGCHLDLSPTEIDALRRQADDDRECPNCARWLVL